MSMSRRHFMHAASAGFTLPAWFKSGLTNREMGRGYPLPPQAEVPLTLDRNENAYGPSLQAISAVKGAAERIHCFPDDHKWLTELIARRHRTSADRVMLASGSCEIMRMAAAALLGPGKTMIQARPTFDCLETYSHDLGGRVISVAVDHFFAHDLLQMFAQIDRSTALIYICNPSSATGSLTARKDLETFISQIPSHICILVDEAYHEYAGESERYSSFIDRPVEHEGLLVTRTFSKAYGLAGLRIGYAVGSPSLLAALRPYVPARGIAELTALAAGAALEDQNHLEECQRRNADDRQEFYNQAIARRLAPIDSHTNFVTVGVDRPAKLVADHFRKNGVLVAGPFSPLETYLRISLGAPEAMKEFWRVADLLPLNNHM